MAITILDKPQAFTPAYNDLFFILNSTDKTEDGFRYIVWVYINGVQVKKDKIIPQFGSNLYGRVSLSKVVASYLTYTNIFPKGSVSAAKDGLDTSYVQLLIKVGQEHLGSAWDFDDWIYAGSINWTNFSSASINPGGLSRVALRSTTTEPPYSAGDDIEVTMDDPNTNPSQTGIHKVLDKENTSGTTWILVLELPWNTFQTPTSYTGSTSYANGEKTVTEPTSGIDSTRITCFNGALPFENFKDWQASDYTPNTATPGKFLTSIPRGITWKVREDSVVFLQYRNANDGNTWDLVYDYSTGNDDFTVSSAVDGVVMVDASPNRITASGVVDYDVFLEINRSRATEKLAFTVDSRCYEWDDVEIVFLDRLGSMLPFQFNLRKTKKQNSNKTFYKKDVDTDEMYDYSLLDGGKLPVNIEEDITYTLRTEPLTYEEANYMRELITSPFTAVRFGSGDYMRCNVLTKNLTIKESGFAELNYYTIEIELSNQDKINW